MDVLHILYVVVEILVIGGAMALASFFIVFRFAAHLALQSTPTKLIRPPMPTIAFQDFITGEKRVSNNRGEPTKAYFDGMPTEVLSGIILQCPDGKSLKALREASSRVNQIWNESPALVRRCRRNILLRRFEATIRKPPGLFSTLRPDDLEPRVRFQSFQQHDRGRANEVKQAYDLLRNEPRNLLSLEDFKLARKGLISLRILATGYTDLTNLSLSEDFGTPRYLWWPESSSDDEIQVWYFAPTHWDEILHDVDD